MSLQYKAIDAGKKTGPANCVGFAAILKCGLTARAAAKQALIQKSGLMLPNEQPDTVPTDDSESDSDRHAELTPEVIDALAEAEAAATTQATATRTPELYAASLANACTAARIADELRGKRIVVLDMTEQTSIVDFFIIVTGTSSRQLHAIADEVNRKLKHEDGNRRLSIEGYRTGGNWILTDYGDVVLHVFTPEGRQLYALEQLWADARRIDWRTGLPLDPNAPPESETDSDFASLSLGEDHPDANTESDDAVD